MILAAMFTVSAMGQQPLTKMGFIDTGAFASEKDGIKSYVAALTRMETQLKPQTQELQALQTKLVNLQNEIRKLQEAPATPGQPPVDIRAKQEEGARLQREFEFKNKEYEAQVQKLRVEILGPLDQQIGQALDDYAKQKGYVAIFDIAPLAEAGVVVALHPDGNVTADFITFFNARPAGSATARP